MKIRIMFYLILLILPFSAHSILSASDPGAEVKKNDWMNSMSSVFPVVLCNPDQYFRQCFNISAQQCEQTAASTTRVCLNKNKDNIPAVLRQPKDGSHWAIIIGTCAGEAYEMSLTQKRIKSNRCDDPANWQ